jgi:glyoxylase-like metal-dependent hydrolase (beta-lactamase superfamily II)
MLEEIAADLHRIEIPLPGLSLGFVNSYIVRNNGRSLIVDTGLYNDECLETMKAAQKKLHVDPRRTDYFITHSHGDHLGLVYKLVQRESLIYINELEVQTISKFQTRLFSAETADFLHISGFPEKDPKKIIPPRATREFRTSVAPSFTLVKDKDAIERGVYNFTCIETPGHSKGHMCLYESARKVLLAGDHLLKEITPTIQGRNDGDNPLKNYLASLDKIDRLDIETVLPGHGPIFDDCKGRIEEIRKHHEQRNREIISILREKERSIYELAKLMAWKTVSNSWESMPSAQQYFAAGEAFSHLIYLEKKGEASKRVNSGEALYSCT